MSVMCSPLQVLGRLEEEISTRTAARTRNRTLSMSVRTAQAGVGSRRSVRSMKKRSGESTASYMSRCSDEELFAHAALTLLARQQRATLEDAVDYLHCIADDIGVDAGELARVVVNASERRARGMARKSHPTAPSLPHRQPWTRDTA